MNLSRRSSAAAGLGLAAAASPFAAAPAWALDRGKLTREGMRALNQLESEDDRARALAPRARGILVFPSIIKAGFIFGGQAGDGVLFEHGRAVGFFNLAGGSWGLQAGGQDFAYALFFMTRGALQYLHNTHGWSLGTGPGITVINKGVGATADIRSLTQDVYAFPFNQKGLMADLTLQGTKISRID
jgi:lipid-binding SYLF domain-containing protein